MTPILAIIKLTWKAAFRYRLFLVVGVLLIGSVVGLPLLIKDDGTARGFTQILLTYTLSVITVLLGFATLWLSCGVLARDIEECQMQMVAVKPIARWQIWLGKWIGIVGLNAALLLLAGGSVYGMLLYRASKLPEAQQAVLRNEVFVARNALREPMPDLKSEIDAFIASRVTADIDTNNMDFYYIRQQLEEGYKQQYQTVPPGNRRRWTIPVGLLGRTVGDEVFFLRFRFYGADTNALQEVWSQWTIGSGDKVIRSGDRQLAANTFHEVPVDPGILGAGASFADLLDKDGNLIVEFVNRDNSAVIFPLEDGLEILYRDGGFTLNYLRGLCIILFWLSLLSAMGLAAASYMTFPVACFFSLGMLIVAMSSGSIANTVAEGTIMGLDHETGQPISRAFDVVLIPLFKFILWLLDFVQGYSPVDNLSTGRSITWGALTRAFLQIIVFLCGALAAIGIGLFNRRELATAQSNQ